MKKVLAIILALVMILSLCACGEEPKPTKKPDGPENYPKLLGKLHEGPGWVINEFYIWNNVTNGKIYGYEVLPSGFDVKSGEKLPIIIYTHGNRGNADSLVSEPKLLAKDGIAGITFECQGASSVKPLSDVREATTSSRACDLDQMIEYVKTLSWVDKDKIFIYGQSHGGMAVMMCAPSHNDDVAGVMIESSGMGPDSGNGMVDNDIPEFGPKEGQTWQEFIKGWKGDVIVCNSELDGDAVENGQYTISVYNEREGDGTATFYFCPEGAHTFNSFSEEGQQITLQAMRDMVFGTK